MTGYFSEIWRLRHFWLALVRVDLRKRYRRSIIGMGWSLLQPIAMTLTLCMVFCPLFGQPARSFGPYLLSGLTFWAFFATVVMEGCQCFLGGESYIRQQPAPLAIYPLRTTLGAGFHFLFGLVIALALVWAINGFGNLPALLTLIPTFVLLFIIGWSVALCMGVANVIFQDSQHLIEIVLQVAFYATPVMYRPEMLKGHPLVLGCIHLNPLAALLELIRKPLLEGELPSTWAVGLSGLAALVAVAVAALALQRFEKRMIFYL